MKHIYINTIENSVTIKDNRFKTVKKYENLSKNNSKMLNSIKLIIFAINKITVLDKRYYDEEYLFYITDENILKYIKNNYGFFYKKIDKEWKYDLDNTALSEIGRLLSLLSRFNFIDINYWIEDEEYKMNEKREYLAKLQSEYDSKIQDYLHTIQDLSDDEITEKTCMKLIREIRDIRNEREGIKKQIKKIDRR